MTTLTILLPILQWLASTAGAGEAAKYLLNQARTRWPDVTIINAPQYARWSSLALAALISMFFAGLIAALQYVATGQPLAGIGSALDSALAAALAAIWSQIAHGRQLSTLTSSSLLALAAPLQCETAPSATAAQAMRPAVIMPGINAPRGQKVPRGTLTLEQQADYLAPLEPEG